MCNITSWRICVTIVAQRKRNNAFRAQCIYLYQQYKKYLVLQKSDFVADLCCRQQ
jgi:hypothetical protein